MALLRGHNQLTWLNVRNGSIWCGREAYDTFAGVITGIRLQKHSYEGEESISLDLKMVDQRTSSDVYGLSGTLIAADRVTTYGRMIVTRLYTLGVEGVGREIEISAYSVGKEKVSCAAVRLRGEDRAIQGAPTVDKKDREQLKRQILKMVDELIEWHGAFNHRDSAAIEPESLDDDVEEEPSLQPSADRSGDARAYRAETMKLIGDLAPSVLGEAWADRLDQYAGTISDGACAIWSMLDGAEMQQLLDWLRGQSPRVGGRTPPLGATDRPTNRPTNRTEPGHILRIRSAANRLHWTAGELEFLLSEFRYRYLHEVPASAVQRIVIALEDPQKHAEITESIEIALAEQQGLTEAG